MKKIIIAISVVGLMATVSFATIQNNKITDKIINKIERIRSSAHGCYMVLNEAKSALQSLNSNYGSEIDAADTARLTELFNDIVAARAELNTLISNIDINFPSIQ